MTDEPTRAQPLTADEEAAPSCNLCDDTGECQGCGGVGKWGDIECSECHGSTFCHCQRYRITVITPGVKR